MAEPIGANAFAFEGELVEERLVGECLGKRAICREQVAQGVCACIGERGGFLQSFLPHEREVCANPEAHDALRGADVGRCLFAPDVLLAGLHGQHESAAAFGVCRHAYEATGHFAHEVFLAA